MESKKLTSASGAPVADNHNVATAGRRGPMLLQDVWFLEKLAHFDREVIPERRMHAKGSGAFGNGNSRYYFLYEGSLVFSDRKRDRGFCPFFHSGR